MNVSRFGILTLAAFVALCSTAQMALPDPPEGLSSDDRAAIDRQLADLASQLASLRQTEANTPDSPAGDLAADAAIYHKGVQWALRYESKLEPADVALLQTALTRGLERAEDCAAGQPAWPAKKGRLVRGYISAVDGSVQPFGLIVPDSYHPARPMRLDVVLHGSSKPVGLSELKFISRFDEGDTGGEAPAADYIELHPLGRVENCYRWAGETDVFEAIEAVSRNYNIDRDRIVLRGMSMGASGTWHLGLKHPDRFVALGPYCGYVDTHRFSETPLPNFIKVGPLPPHQELALHMLDSVDYAANAGVVPAIACMGDKDIFFQAHVIMAEAMRSEGLQMVNLISPGTGHTIDPITQAEQMRLIGAFADHGLDHAPRKLRFVTWTLKYNHCHWLEVLGLKEHYARAELSASIAADGAIEVDEPQNITRFAIRTEHLSQPVDRLRVGGHDVPLPTGEGGKPQPIRLALADGQWSCVAADSLELSTGKRPGLQGPIDDAFTAPFLCVRGTGEPWNREVQAWSEAGLRRFAYEWARYFRGDLPIKDDRDVTADDVSYANLILFGDPGSNSYIRQVLPHLPLEWTRDELRLGDERYPAHNHAPILIHPNPLPGAEGRYIVLNSGHTFHESELAAVNYLLFPRLGDWAVLRVGGQTPATSSEPLDEEVLRAGFFDEAWRVKK